MLPGDIAAVGDGRRGTQTRQFTAKQGDTVLYSKFGIGCTDVNVKVRVHCWAILVMFLHAMVQIGQCWEHSFGS